MGQLPVERGYRRTLLQFQWADRVIILSIRLSLSPLSIGSPRLDSAETFICPYLPQLGSWLSQEYNVMLTTWLAGTRADRC